MLYGDCMQPDYMANIAYQCLLIWMKISYKKANFFMYQPPYGSDGVFERVSALWVHPFGFYLKKPNIDENIRGGRFVGL